MATATPPKLFAVCCCAAFRTRASGISCRSRSTAGAPECASFCTRSCRAIDHCLRYADYSDYKRPFASRQSMFSSEKICNRSPFESFIGTIRGLSIFVHFNVSHYLMSDSDLNGKGSRGSTACRTARNRERSYESAALRGSARTPLIGSFTRFVFFRW